VCELVREVRQLGVMHRWVLHRTDCKREQTGGEKTRGRDNQIHGVVGQATSGGRTCIGKEVE
jgi:hypothetical protein